MKTQIREWLNAGKKNMSKINLIIAALLFSASLLTAQTPEKKTIRVKKVEIINGVEKITDTTYSVDGPVTLQTLEKIHGTETTPGKECNPKKMVIVTDQVSGDNVTIINKEEEMDEQMERALKAAAVDGKTLGVDKVMIMNMNEKDSGNKQVTKVVIVKTIKIIDPSTEDTKMLGKQTGVIDNKLAIDQMKFFPNPSNGKFTLNFNLAAKGNTEVSILNLEGKTVYSEELKDFTGNYNKEIDISANPKGVYFIKIKQGAHAQLKKIVLE